MTKPQRCALLVESGRRERGEGAAGGREIKLHGLMVGALTEDTWKFKKKKERIRDNVGLHLYL